MLTELFDKKQPPVASLSAGLLAGRDPVRSLARSVMRELDVLMAYNDPRNMYARMPYVLHIH